MFSIQMLLHFSQIVSRVCTLVLFIFIINPFQSRSTLGQKNVTKADLNCKSHAVRTDKFTSPRKDVMQDVPTHWVEKLSTLSISK